MARDAMGPAQLGVRDRRQMFNRAAAGSVWVTAASCAVVGASMAGGAGAIVGGLLGLMLTGHVFRNSRFIR
jgi:ABC-type xylose transport system permease subunit